MNNKNKITENCIKMAANIGKVSLDIVSITKSSIGLPYYSEFDINELSEEEIAMLIEYIETSTSACLPKECERDIKIAESEIKGTILKLTITSHSEPGPELLN